MTKAEIKAELAALEAEIIFIEGMYGDALYTAV